jgi:mRNA interferase RelE/StbE
VGRYSVFIKPSALQEIEAIDRKADRQRIVRRIQSLATNPRPAGCEKLSGREKYRVRQGRYRILYSIDDEILVVQVVKVGHRKDVYR